MFVFEQSSIEPIDNFPNSSNISYVCLFQGLLLVGAGLVIAQPVITYQELKQAGSLSLGSELNLC